MAGSPLNPLKTFKRQGLDPRVTYSAVVVDNNDPRKLRRVRARIEGIQDGIKDEHLPWAIPTDQNYTAAGDNRSGIVNIPEKGAKVGLKFPSGDPHKPMLVPHPTDEQTVLPESEKNYPDRKILRFSNGFSIVVDTIENECLLVNPGDMHLCVIGDCTQTVIGNHTMMVSGSKGDIPAYFKNASKLQVDKLKASSAGNVPFKGKGSKGSQFLHIKGDQTVKIDGNRTVEIKGNDTLKVGRNRDEKITGTHTVKSMRTDLN